MNNVIEVLDTVVWSELKWEESCETTVDINTLLPQVGERYFLPLHFNQQNPKNGKTTIVWKPPHSELNGWDDKRPSDILKSYVVEGEVNTQSRDSDSFEFMVSRLEKLTTAFEKLEKSDDQLFNNNPYNLGWHKASQLKHALVGSYIYIHGGYEEIQLEAILSRVDDNLCLHYSAFQPSPSQFETVLMRSYLTGLGREIIEKVIGNSKLIEDNSLNELAENQVYGVEYL